MTVDPGMIASDVVAPLAIAMAVALSAIPVVMMAMSKNPCPCATLCVVYDVISSNIDVVVVEVDGVDPESVLCEFRLYSSRELSCVVVFDR